MDFSALKDEGTAVFLNSANGVSPPSEGFPHGEGKRIFLRCVVSVPALRLLGGILAWGVKRPGREADHSRLSSAEVQNFRSCCLHTASGNAWVKGLDTVGSSGKSERPGTVLPAPLEARGGHRATDMLLLFCK